MPLDSRIIPAVILAAGDGERMKSKKSKLTHDICGKSIVEWVFFNLKQAGINREIIVAGFDADRVLERIGERADYVLQEERLGTAHALMLAMEKLNDHAGTLLVIYGSMPLVTPETIKQMLIAHEENKNAATYVEGGGVYCFDKDSLEAAFRKQAAEVPLGGEQEHGKNERYGFSLSKTLRILGDIGYRTQSLCLVNREETINITDRIKLSQAERIIRKRILEKLMLDGVTILDPDSTYIDAEVKIGIDTQIFPGTIIKGATVIGEECTIGPNAVIYSSVIGNRVTVDSSEVKESSIGDGTKIGPFAYIRPASNIGSNVKIGDFVEVKKSSIGDDTKISHLTYVGDSEVGRNVNIGCGVVFVNYNGKEKNKCIVGDNAFIGCNTNLVAPVEVKNDSYIAAGSTITETVPEHSLAIARERQINKENWVIKKNMQRAPKEGDVK